MNLLFETLGWLADPTNWSGAGSIPQRLLEHLGITALTVLIAGAVALPAGFLIGHTGRGAGFVGALTGAARAIPTLGLLTLAGLIMGIGLQAPLLALVVLAVPSLLAGAYAGVQAVDSAVPAAAKALGMTPVQVFFKAELPLAAPVVVGGIRAATLQVAATATLAAYTANLGLGRYIFSGLKSRNYVEMLGGALLVTVLALLLEISLSALQRYSTNRLTRSPQPLT